MAGACSDKKTGTKAAAKTGTKAASKTGAMIAAQDGAMARTGASSSLPNGPASAYEIERMLADLGLVEAAAGSSTQFDVDHPVPFNVLALADDMVSGTHQRPGCIAFAKSPTPQHLAAIAAMPRLLLLLPPDAATAAKTTAPAGRWLYCSNPRLAFAMALQTFFELTPAGGIDPSAQVHEDAEIGDEAHIAAFVVIGAGAVVGRGAIICAHAVIHAGVRIGQDCRIGAGSCLGGSGFGYERDHHGIPWRVPQLGALIIEDDVEIGENVTINRAALNATIIKRHAKIDDHAYIAHNVQIGRSAILMAGVRILGGATIGAGAEINPGALIGQGVRVGAGAVIAMGAVVLQDVPDGAFAAGVPAKVRRRGVGRARP